MESKLEEVACVTDCLENPEACNCRFCSMFQLLGRKWTLHIVGYLHQEGTVRFNELQRAMGGISPRVLSDRLSSLEARGLVERVEHEQIPPKVEYSITEKGADLERVLEALVGWADDWGVPIKEDA